jgi:hypothetical protein
VRERGGRERTRKQNTKMLSDVFNGISGHRNLTPSLSVARVFFYRMLEGGNNDFSSGDKNRG